MGQKAPSFSVSIEGEGISRLIHNKVQIALIPSGCMYKIVLHNASSGRCDVVIAIDECEIGKWRLEAREILTLEEYPRTGIKFRILEGGEVIRAMFIPEKAWLSESTGDEVRTSPGGAREVAYKKGSGGLTSIAALGRSNVDWNKVVEVPVKLVLG